MLFGEGILEELEPFLDHLDPEHVDAGDVSGGPREARHVALCQRIVADREHHDGNRASGGHGGAQILFLAQREDEVDAAPDQFAHGRLVAIEMTFEGDVIDGECVAFDVAQLAQPADEGHIIRRHVLGTHRMHEAESQRFGRHLGVRALPRSGDTHRRTAERGYELPPSDAYCHLPRPQWDHVSCDMERIVCRAWACNWGEPNVPGTVRRAQRSYSRRTTG